VSRNHRDAREWANGGGYFGPGSAQTPSMHRVPLAALQQSEVVLHLLPS